MHSNFFWMCSGADPDILKECPKSEQIKYAGIGGTVFFTAVVAAIAAGYALYIVFDSVLVAIPFGLLWGLLIFNLDRYIVSTIKKRDDIVSELVQASPRILLAILIAFVISKPLELKIFEKEIDQVLLGQKQDLSLEHKGQVAAYYQTEINRLEQDIQGRRQAVANKEAQVNSLYQTYIDEAEGTAGTMKEGKGPVYKEKRQKHDAELAALQQLRSDNQQKISEAEGQLAMIRQEQTMKEAEGQPIIEGFDGLMARIGALNELSFLPSFFIFLLFLAVETAPIMAKLLSPKGIYDMRLQDIEEGYAAWMKQKQDSRYAMLATDEALNKQAFGELADEHELALYKRQRARELLQLQADAIFKDQKRWF